MSKRNLDGISFYFDIVFRSRKLINQFYIDVGVKNDYDYTPVGKKIYRSGFMNFFNMFNEIAIRPESNETEKFRNEKESN